MKSNILRRAIALLLSLMTVISIMSIPMTASARYTDAQIDAKISYDSLNCREDDCDCLEPENNRFAVVSPVQVAADQDETAYIKVDTYQNVQKYFDEQGWTDGLPIVPPTWIKAEKFMRYTSYKNDDVVATVNGTDITAYTVAVNAIMSGCSAEYLPVCIAFVQALGNADYLDSLRSGELTPMMYVNGPIARQLGIDNGQGMTTEECNIAIARFMELALINIARLQRTHAFGNVQPLVFSEDEQNCINIGWDPHHVEAGYDLNDNVITATSFSMWGNNVTPATDLPVEIMKVLAWDITEKNLGGLGGASVEDNADTKRTILITPSVATALSKKYKSKDALESALVENARRPLWMRTYAYYYTNIGSNLIGDKSFSDVYDELAAEASEDAEKTASPAWMNGITYAEIDTVATMTKGNTNIVIQGDEARNKTQVMPGGVSVSKDIKLPSDWDALLESMIISIVYPSLAECEIEAVAEEVTKLPTSTGIPTEIQVTSSKTYTVAASTSYVTSTNRIYYDSATSTLHYYNGSAQSVILDTEVYADFITLVEAIGRNGTIKLDRNNKITAVSAVFKTNANFDDQNLVDYTDAAFTSAPLTIAYNSRSIDGSFMTMSADLTTFTADLGGDIVMGDESVEGFVSVSGTTVTVDPTVEAGATSVIGVSDGNGAYRTMTFVNGGDGTYTVRYNTGNTLTLGASSYYLKGTFNSWGDANAFVKTDNDDILTTRVNLTKGEYTFKVEVNGEWYGNDGAFTETANRWTMSTSGGDCTMTASSDGLYEFKYEISTDKLSVYPAEKDATATLTTKTVYVGVIEYITDFVPTLHFWDPAGDAVLEATGETVQYALGSAYWSNAKQNFKVYKAEIPVAATKMKTWNGSANNAWAEEEITYAEDQILLVWEYSDKYHNVAAAYSPEDPSEEETEAPTQAPTQKPTEAPTEKPTEAPTQAPTDPPICEAGYYLVGTLGGENLWGPETLDESRMFKLVDGEYKLDYTLTAGDEFKVVYTDGYTITEWFKSEGEDPYVATADEAHDVTICFNPEGNANWTYNYISVQVPEPITVYLINSREWETVNAYAWTEGGDSDAKWPGTAMTKTDETVNGFDVYSIQYYNDYESIIFNNGTSQTADLTLENGKYYNLGNGTWYDNLEDVPEEVESEYMTIYFKNNWKWTNVCIHVWNSKVEADTTWPGKAMTLVGNDGTDDIYMAVIPKDAYFIINGIKDDGSGNRDQTPDIKTGAEDGNCYQMTWNDKNDVIVKDIIDVYPDAVPVTPSGIYKTVYFMDKTEGRYIDNDDANMFVYSNAGDKVKMTQTVDTVTGEDIWYGKIDDAATGVTFHRASYYFDEDNASSCDWGTWSAGTPTDDLYVATASATGSWKSDEFAVPDGTMEDFWYGLWIDSVGSGDAQHAIRLYKDGSRYELYVPSFVNLAEVEVYSSFEKFTVDGTTYDNGDPVNLTTGSHTITGVNGTTTTNLGTLVVYQSEDTASMLMTTKEELYTGTTAGYSAENPSGLNASNAWPAGSGITATNFNGVYKDAIETKGSYYFYAEDGSQVNSDTVLKKIKGRGNSTFEASMRIYGKYAYNFNLDKKVDLVGGATEAKKWSMLANNGDVTMLRNTLIYSIAEDLGIKYTPNTRLTDVYDNGKYLGSYIVAEKVEYGKNTLMKDMQNLDDGNEDANIAAYDNEDIMDDLEGHLVQAETSVTVNGQKYTYQYTTSDDPEKWPYHQPSVELTEKDYTEYNYLLEFELYNRYKAEASWFVSPRTGQAVVVKYPEFATKDEMEWIISEYETAESAIYGGDYTEIDAAVDVDSFAKMYLIQELSINLDGGATSFYVHNDLASGKLVSSPVWDYDWTMGAFAGSGKFIYNETKKTTEDSPNMSDPEQMFINKKALKTDGAQKVGEYVDNYNFQAMFVQNDTVWERCQYIWTNEMIDILPKYIDNDYIDAEPQADDGVTEGKLLTEWLPAFTSSLEMNDARWGSFTFTKDNWGTKITTDYVNRSFDFKIGNTATSGSATKSYANSVYYLNDWLVKRWNYMSSEDGGALYRDDLLVTYEFDKVAFDAVQSDDESTVTITPDVTVTYDGEAVDASELEYTVYVNDTAVSTYPLTENATVKLEEGIKNEVYIVVFPTAEPDRTGESEKQEFSYGYVPVDVTIYFKSSTSYRYIPKLTVNGGEVITMTKPTSTSEAISHNSTRTQYYYWYKAEVTLDADETATLLFSNAYSMRASATLSGMTDGAEYYFGCDNMNNGSTAVNLTEYTGEYEYIRNFVKSATHMVYNEATDAGVATTSIDGTIYKMGDADCDNTVSILDATTVQLALVEKEDLDDTQTALADYDLDQVNSIVDATLIQTYLVNN